MPICNVCRDCLEGIWDPSKTKRVCTVNEWEEYVRERFRKPHNTLKPAVPEVSGELGDGTSKDMERSDIPEEPLESEESEESQDNTPECMERLHMPVKADELEKSEASEDGTSEDAERSNMPEHFLFGHHATKESFLQAKNQNCVVCSIVYLWFRIRREEPDSKISKLGYYTLSRVTRNPQLSMNIYQNDQEPFCFDIVPHVSSMNLNLDIGSNTGDEVTWDIIRGWLDECLEKHTRCNQKNIADYVPSRLVKLNDTTAEPTFCVVEKSQVDPQSPYLTLSHRWGESSQLRLKLTRSTSERLSREQPCHTLPKTFRDASEVARRLKICYLWIDSLCIFQDSTEDWRKESSSMRDVYGNAFLNIAALGAEDNDGGLFFSRNPSEVKPTIFNFSVNGPEDPHLYRFEYDDGYSNGAFWKGPILQRGWVLQERILSRRVLYFGSRQVFWECYEITCSEGNPKDASRYLYNQDDKKEQGEIRTEPNHHAWKALMGADRLQPSCEDKLSQLFMDWYDILETYITCDLTVSSDKLVALSGIAKDMKRHLTTLGCRDTKYLAGLWSQDLPHALLWRMHGFGRRPESYRAPSWSWAAVDGSSWMSSYGRTDFEILVSVTSARTTLENDEDETGKVRGGMLTLTGILATANVDLSAEKTDKQESNKRRIIDFQNHEDGTPLPKFYNDPYVVFDTKEIYPRVLCLIMHENRYMSIEGLAMVQVGHENYRRVGLFRWDVNPGDSVQSVFANASQGSVDVI